MKQVLEMIFKNLGEWVYLADVEEMVGLSNAQNAVDQLLNKELIKYCGCDCGGFMITEKGIEHLEQDAGRGPDFKVVEIQDRHPVVQIPYSIYRVVHQASGEIIESFFNETDADKFAASLNGKGK